MLGSRARVYASAASRRRTAVLFWLHSLLIRSARIRAVHNGVRQSPDRSAPRLSSARACVLKYPLPGVSVIGIHWGQEPIHPLGLAQQSALARAHLTASPTTTMEVMIMSARPG